MTYGDWRRIRDERGIGCYVSAGKSWRARSRTSSSAGGCAASTSAGRRKSGNGCLFTPPSSTSDSSCTATSVSVGHVVCRTSQRQPSQTRPDTMLPPSLAKPGTSSVPPDLTTVYSASQATYRITTARSFTACRLCNQNAGSPLLPRAAKICPEMLSNPVSYSPGHSAGDPCAMDMMADPNSKPAQIDRLLSVVQHGLSDPRIPSTSARDPA